MALELTVPNMACSACGDTIAQAIQTIDPQAIVQTDPKTKLVKIETQADEAAIKQAITTVGYTVA
jgi:copper chaperone